MKTSLIWMWFFVVLFCMEGDVKSEFHKGWRGSSNPFWGDQIDSNVVNLKDFPYQSAVFWVGVLQRSLFEKVGETSRVSSTRWKAGCCEWFLLVCCEVWRVIRISHRFLRIFGQILFRRDVFFDIFIQPPVRIPSSNMKSLLQIWKILAGFSSQNRFAEKSNLRFCREPVLSRPI